MKAVLYQAHPVELRNEWGRMSCNFYYRDIPIAILCRFLIKGYAEIEEKMFVHPRGIYHRVFIPQEGVIELTLPENRRIVLEYGKIYWLPDDLQFQVLYRKAKFHFFHLAVTDSMNASPFTGIRDQVFEWTDPHLRQEITEAFRKGAEALLRLQSALLLLLAKLLSPRLPSLAAVSSGMGKNHLPSLQQLLRRRPPAQLTVKDLAESLHLSRGALGREFQRNYGMPLKRFLLEFQLREAYDRLLGSSDPVAEVARKLGYESPNYFFRFFRKQTGMTPGEFRKSVTHGDSAEFIGKFKESQPEVLIDKFPE